MVSSLRQQESNASYKGYQAAIALKLYSVKSKNPYDYDSNEWFEYERSYNRELENS